MREAISPTKKKHKKHKTPFLGIFERLARPRPTTPHSATAHRAATAHTQSRSAGFSGGWGPVRRSAAQPPQPAMCVRGEMRALRGGPAHTCAEGQPPPQSRA